MDISTECIEDMDRNSVNCLSANLKIQIYLLIVPTASRIVMNTNTNTHSTHNQHEKQHQRQAPPRGGSSY